MVPISEAETVRKISELAYSDAMEIVSLIEILETQNSGGVNENISKAAAGAAGIVVRNSLITRLVIVVTRAYADARPGDLHLQRGFDLLKDAQVRSEFEGLGLQATLIEAEKHWQRCKGDNRMRTLRHFRDKYTAHLGQPKETPLPLYQEMFAAAVATVAAMEKLAFATGVANVPVQEQVDAESSARAFWGPWGKFS
jgi:hypothetical protein